MPEEAAVRFRRWFPVSKVRDWSMESSVHGQSLHSLSGIVVNECQCIQG